MKFVQVLRMVFLVLVILQICLVVLPFGNRVMADGGDLLWEQGLQYGFYNVPLQVWVEGQQLIVVGWSMHPPNEDDPPNLFKNRVRLFWASYDLTTGAGGVVWSDSYGGRGCCFLDNIEGLVVNAQNIFLLRRRYDEDYPDRTWLRKYDRLHGTLLWEQEVFGAISDKWWVTGSSLTASGGKVFVSGSTGRRIGDSDSQENPQAFTRAYNGDNGHVIWSTKDPLGSRAGASVASGNRVYIVVRAAHQVLRAYNASTGAKVWERIIDPNKGVGPMRVSGNQLFLAGYTNRGGAYRADHFVQADAIDKGTLLWENSPKTVGDDWANDIAVASQKVFMGGAATNAAGSQDFMVRAYDALTGRLLWKSLADAGGSDSVYGVVANSSLGRVFAVGAGGIDSLYLPYSGHALVRAYNMNTGALAWESFIDDGSDESVFAESGSQAVVAGEKLFVVGVKRVQVSGDDFDIQPVMIRAYDAK